MTHPAPSNTATRLAGHRWGVAVFTLALCLRVATCIAYRPAFEFNGDSYDYLANARHLNVHAWHPLGYPVLLRVLSWTGTLLAVPVTQHLLGLATGVLIYRLARQHIGASDLVAAAAAAPVLLDAWQVVVEHTILAEPVFEFVLVVMVTLLLRAPATRSAAIAVAVLLAAAVLLRTVALVCLPIVACYLWRRARSWRPALVFVVVAVAPLLAYAAMFHAAHGSFALAGDSSRYLYGEVATFADCSHVASPDQALCPKLPAAERPGSNYYVWDRRSPYTSVLGADGSKVANARAASFNRHVIARQPADFVRYVATTLAHYLEPGRVTGPRDFPVQAVQFPATARTPPLWHSTVATVGYAGEPVTPGFSAWPAHALRAYQRIGFLPGPLLGVCLVLALAGVVARGIPRHRDLALLTGCGVALVGATAISAGFDYRYELPGLVFLPLAGAMALPPLRRRLATRVPIKRLLAVGTVTVAGLVASNLAYANVTSIDRQLAPPIHAVGDEAVLPGGLAVRLVNVAVGRASCAAIEPGGRPVELRSVTARLTVRLTRPGSHLAAPDNVFVDTHDGYLLGHELRGDYVAATVVGPRRPSADVVVGFTLPLGIAHVVYTDPNGAGSVAWSVPIGTTRATSGPRSACVAAAPTAGRAQPAIAR